jgi:hypothetical protein
MSNWHEIVQRMEAAAGPQYPNYRRYYAAVSRWKPDPANIPADINQYYGLMIPEGAARISVRGIYNLWGRPSAPEVVKENTLPMIFDGGCSVVTVFYDGARQTVLPPKCDGH